MIFSKFSLTRIWAFMTDFVFQISLNNVVMELRKLCCHGYMLEGVDPGSEDANEAYR